MNRRSIFWVVSVAAALTAGVGCQKKVDALADAGISATTAASTVATAAATDSTVLPADTSVPPLATNAPAAAKTAAAANPGTTAATAAVTDPAAAAKDAGATATATAPLTERDERVQAVKTLQARLEADKRFKEGCTFLVPTGVHDGVVEITFNQKTGGKCGGDPAKAPAPEQFRVSTKKGVIQHQDPATKKWQQL